VPKLTKSYIRNPTNAKVEQVHMRLIVRRSLFDYQEIPRFTANTM